MSKNPISPQLFDVLDAFLAAIRKKLPKDHDPEKILKLAGKGRANLVVFLENFTTQICNAEFGIDLKQILAIRPALIQKLKKPGWAKKQPKELLAVGHAISAVLYNWPDIVGSTYVSNSGIFLAVLQDDIPRLLHAVTAYAEVRHLKDVRSRSANVIRHWEEIFGA